MCHQETAVRGTGVAQGRKEEPARLEHTHEPCPHRLLVEIFAVRGHLPTHRSREGGCNFYPGLRFTVGSGCSQGSRKAA